MNTNEYIKHQLLKNPDVKHLMDYMRTENHKCYVAGGAITCIATGKFDQIEDYDIYFGSVESAVVAIRYMKENNPHVAFVSDKSITYVMKDGVKIQFVYNGFYPKAEDIFKDFDFYLCMGAYDNLKDSVIVHENFWMHNSQRYIGFNTGTKYPIISQLRLDKYKGRGYKTSRNEQLKIALTIADLNLTTWEEAKAQIGNTYGFTLADFKDCENTPFSIDALIERIESTSDGEDLPMQEHYLYPHDAVDFMLEGKSIEYILIGDEQNYVDPYVLEAESSVKDLISRGLLTTVEVSKDEFLQGDFFVIESNSKNVGDIINRTTYIYNREHLENSYYGSNDKVIYKVSFYEDDVKTITDGYIAVSKCTLVEKVCRASQISQFNKGEHVEYRPNANMKRSSSNNSGWAFKENSVFIQGEISQLKKMREEHIKNHVLITESGVGYAHHTFAGVILQGGEDITAEELLYFMDGFNLSFGGNIAIHEDGTFSGRYNTD